MTDFCSIAIRIKEEDKNMVMIPSCSKGEDVKLNGDWLVVDCSFNDCAPLSGVIEDIGSALIINYNDYNKALDLILGGNIRYLDKYEIRYDICEDMLNMTWDEVKPQVLNEFKDFEKLDKNGLVFFFEDDEWAYTNMIFSENESVKDALYKGESDYSLASKLVNVLEKVDNVEEEMIRTITEVMRVLKKVDFAIVDNNDDEILAPLYKTIKMTNDGSVVLVDRGGLEIDIEVINSLNTLYVVCEYLDSFVHGDFDD